VESLSKGGGTGEGRNSDGILIKMRLLRGKPAPARYPENKKGKSGDWQKDTPTMTDLGLLSSNALPGGRRR